MNPAPAISTLAMVASAGRRPPAARPPCAGSDASPSRAAARCCWRSRRAGRRACARLPRCRCARRRQVGLGKGGKRAAQQIFDQGLQGASIFGCGEFKRGSGLEGRQFTARRAVAFVLETPLPHQSTSSGSTSMDQRSPAGPASVSTWGSQRARNRCKADRVADSMSRCARKWSARAGDQAGAGPRILGSLEPVLGRPRPAGRRPDRRRCGPPRAAWRAANTAASPPAGAPRGPRRRIRRSRR